MDLEENLFIRVETGILMENNEKKALISELESMKISPVSTVADILISMRPHQWTKNVLLLAAFFFAFWDRSQSLAFSHLGSSVAAMIIFCIVSGAVYIMNDIHDIDSDRLHPVKRNRPIAAGRLTVVGAQSMALLLLAVGFTAAAFLSRSFAGIVVAYVVLQILYSFALKQIALLDIMIISVGFVLRAIAGALVINVHISPWLLLCTFLLSLFLVLAKRRSEKNMEHTPDHSQRTALENYDMKLLDQMLGITSAATIVAYCIYTLDHQTVEKFGTTRLGYTVPFVVFGIFRYLDLVYRHKKGERPELILLTDTPTIVNIFIYLITLIIVFSL